jgi:hypothetical protein
MPSTILLLSALQVCAHVCLLLCAWIAALSSDMDFCPSDAGQFNLVCSQARLCNWVERTLIRMA